MIKKSSPISPIFQALHNFFQRGSLKTDISAEILHSCLMTLNDFMRIWDKGNLAFLLHCLSSVHCSTQQLIHRRSDNKSMQVFQGTSCTETYIPFLSFENFLFNSFTNTNVAVGTDCRGENCWNVNENLTYKVMFQHSSPVQEVLASDKAVFFLMGNRFLKLLEVLWQTPVKKNYDTMKWLQTTLSLTFERR